MTTPSQKAAPAIPRTVWALGMVSLLMDLSSEATHALLPLFLTTSLGASVAMVGLIDGVAEATASVTKVFSGYLSDRFGRRKPLILIGYSLGALSKPIFALAGSAQMVMAARLVDRVGKGVRGAPRDALVADATPPEIRGRAFGLRQSLDTVGAFAGPLLAIALMALFANDMRLVFWIAAVPAALSVACAVFFVVEPAAPSPGTATPPPIGARELARLPRRFWLVVSLGTVFTLARFSEAFLILKATQEGLPLTLAPLVLVAMNVVYAAGAYPVGNLSDRMPAKVLLALGLLLLIIADLVLGLSSGLVATFVGITLWGGHMAMTQGLLAKLVADTAPQNLRASAYGMYHLATGAALLPASLIAGLLWDRVGSGATFLAGAAFATIARISLAIGRRPRGRIADTDR